MSVTVDIEFGCSLIFPLLSLPQHLGIGEWVSEWGKKNDLEKRAGVSSVFVISLSCFLSFSICVSFCLFLQDNCVRVLLVRGANKEVKNFNSQTPFQVLVNIVIFVLPLYLCP